VCLSVCLSLAAFPHYCTDPDVTWRNSRGYAWLCTIGRTCNRCTGFVATTTQRRSGNVSERLYSLMCVVRLVMDLLSTCCTTSCRILWNVADLLYSFRLVADLLWILLFGLLYNKSTTTRQQVEFSLYHT